MKAKKLLAVLLTVAMTMSMLSSVALGAENAEIETEAIEVAEEIVAQNDELIEETIDEDEAIPEDEEAIEEVAETSEEAELFESEVVATIGDVDYTSIDDAILAWTNGTTLTLKADVTLSDVIKLNSTERRTLNLGTYKMTAASGNNAIEIIPKGVGTTSKECLTINADETAPGGISAPGKSCIYYLNSNKIADRMTVTINGGIFEGKYAIYAATGPLNKWGIVTNPVRGQSCPYFVLNGGTYEASVYLYAGMLKLTGGTYNQSFNCNGDATAYRLVSGGRFKSAPTFTDGVNDEGNPKLVFGTNKNVFYSNTYDVDIYIDDEGYYVVDGSGVSAKPGRFEASCTDAYKSMFDYSAIAADKTVYCTSADYAVNNKTNVKLYVDYSADKAVKSGTYTLDATAAAFTGDVTLTKTAKFVIKYNEDAPYTGTVVNDTNMYGIDIKETVENGVVTKTYTGYEIIDETNATLRVEYDNKVEYFKSFQSAFETCNGTTGKTIVLMANISGPFINSNRSTEATNLTLDLNGYNVTNYLNGNTAATASVVNIVDNSYYKTSVVSSTDFLSRLASCKYTPVVKGGTWPKDPSAYVAEGYRAVVTDDGQYFVIRYEEEATIELYAPAEVTTFATGNSDWMLVGSYVSLEEAIAAANDGYKIKLIDDIEIENNTIIDKNITVDLNDYTISVAENEKLVIAEEVNIFGGTIDGDIEVESNGYLNIEKFKAFGKINVNTNGDMKVSSGWYKYIIEDKYIADGYEIAKTADGYIIVDEKERADSIGIEYKDITKDGTEGEKTYEIYVKANEYDFIHELASADISFKFTVNPVTNGAISMDVAPAKNFMMTRYEAEDRYMFNYNGTTAYQDSGNAILIGTIKVTGYGSFKIETANAPTNIVNATTLRDNLVDSYTAQGGLDSDPTTGILNINTDSDTTDELYGSITNGSIAIPTRNLDIKVSFPNAVEANSKDYQDMTITITGPEGYKNVIDLADGIDGENLQTGADGVVYYEKTVSGELTLNSPYTVTVEGAGYRTVKYTVNMTENKTLNFWNNVRDNEKAVEVSESGVEKYAQKVTFLAGDIVKDNDINVYDLSAVVSYFGEIDLDADNKPQYAKYDLNRDGKIDSKDVAYVLVSWGN